MTTPVEKMTIDSVVSLQKMNAIRDAIESLRAELLLEHGGDESVLSSASDRLGAHSARTLLGNGVGAVATAIIRLSYTYGAINRAAETVVGDEAYFGTPRLTDFLTDGGWVDIPVRGFEALGATVTATQSGLPVLTWQNFCSAVVQRSSDPLWPWLVRVRVYAGTTPANLIPDSMSLIITLTGY